MSTEDTALLDTRDMVALHRAFRRVLTDAPGQIASVREGDTERSRLLADYLADALWLLHEHHIGEDELLYPLLAERVPEEGELFAAHGGPASCRRRGHRDRPAGRRAIRPVGLGG